jgi:hypothetical protein
MGIGMGKIRSRPRGKYTIEVNATAKIAPEAPSEA